MKTTNATKITAVEMVTALCHLGSPSRRHAKALLRQLFAREDAEALQKVARVAYAHRLELEAGKAQIAARQAARRAELGLWRATLDPETPP